MNLSTNIEEDVYLLMVTSYVHLQLFFYSFSISSFKTPEFSVLQASNLAHDPKIKDTVKN